MKKPMLAVIMLAIVGLALAIYQASHKPADGASCALAGDSCSAVMNSAYSSLFGIPVALIGVFGFMLIIAIAFYVLLRDDKKALKPLFAVSTVGLAFVAYLVYAELVELHAICSLCTVSHIIGIAIWAIVLFSLIKY